MSEEYWNEEPDEEFDEEDEIRRLILEAEANEIWLEETDTEDEDKSDHSDQVNPFPFPKGKDR